MRKSVLKKKWICPVCDAIGNKWLSSHKARMYGKKHLIKSHGIYDKEPDLLIKRVEENY